MNPFPFEDVIHRFTWEHPGWFRRGRGQRLRDWLGRRAFVRLIRAVAELGKQSTVAADAITKLGAVLSGTREP